MRSISLTIVSRVLICFPSFRFTPVLDANKISDQWYTASGGTGEFHIQVSYKPSAVSFLFTCAAQN